MNRRRKRMLAFASIAAAFFVPVFLTPATNASFTDTDKAQVIITFSNEPDAWPVDEVFELVQVSPENSTEGIITNE